MKRGILFAPVLLGTLLQSGCTKLNETVDGNLTAIQVGNSSTTAELLRGVYGSLEFPFTSYLQVFPLSDMTTDEAIAPTRANNWDDNGVWREFHEQKWNSNNSVIHDCFNALGGTVFAATDMLQFKPNLQEQAEARFLRAWAMYWLLDMFDQVPYREPGESVVGPARVRKGLDAWRYIVDELQSALADLPNDHVDGANVYAAKVLLMKCYLNKAVYENRANPNFRVADMDSVILLGDEIIASGRFTFSKNYFDNFSPDNGSAGKENIFTQKSNADGNYQLAFAWQAVLHYSQNGFNGFTTLSDFYNKFDSTDKRRGIAYFYPNSPPNPGKRINLGFLAGPQHDLVTDAPLYGGPFPTDYTPEVKNIENSSNIEMTGIRPLKYAPDYLNYFVFGSPPTNNFVYFRLPDVLLMKSEAILRGGSPTNIAVFGNTALEIVNTIRKDSSRNARPLSSIDLNGLLDERGRELWWENWRRQDMIRFGRFLKPFQEKDYSSDPKYLVFPIPDEQLAVNPNLKQNPGY